MKNKSISKSDLRKIVRDNLDEIVVDINKALKGKTIKNYKTILTRLGRNGKLPHWYAELANTNTLPNLDGKTVGSIIEMLLVAVLEENFLHKMGTPPLKINPARGVDLPDLDLGIKSPSENYCTSEPFYSAYERLIGSEYDALVLLTDYQTAKMHPPLKLQIIKQDYLYNTEIADAVLCRLAKLHRGWLIKTNEAWAQKLFRFLAYVNQSDWRARRILRLISVMKDDNAIRDEIKLTREDYKSRNELLAKKDLLPIPESDINKIEAILKVKPLHLGVLDCADNWVVDTQKDFGRMPNENEWNRLKSAQLNGRIGMSFALQWRYNFGKVFGVENGVEKI